MTGQAGLYLNWPVLITERMLQNLGDADLSVLVIKLGVCPHSSW